MQDIQLRFSENTDRHREPAPSYQVGDQVWLDARNIRTKRPSRKLDYKNLGRFTIKRVLSPWAYELDLPETMQIHPVFHVSKLNPVAVDPLPGQVTPPAPPIEVDGDEEYEVEEILNDRTK